jgi:hypothetical protein
VAASPGRETLVCCRAARLRNILLGQHMDIPTDLVPVTVLTNVSDERKNESLVTATGTMVSLLTSRAHFRSQSVGPGPDSAPERE